MKLSAIKPNPNNPRNISPDKLEKLGRSIKDFSKMMAIRPIVIDKDNIIIGGNQRYYALKKAAIKEIPDEWVKKADDLTDEERRRFIVEDNVGFGEWDFDALSVDYEIPELEEWGLDLPTMENIKLPSDEQEEPETYDGFIVVMKVPNDKMQTIESTLNEWRKDFGIQIDIS